jgi:hypothetical protein
MSCGDSFGGIHCFNVRGQVFALKFATGDVDIIPSLAKSELAAKLTHRVQGFGTIVEDGIELKCGTCVGMRNSDKHDLVADRSIL